MGDYARIEFEKYKFNDVVLRIAVDSRGGKHFPISQCYQFRLLNLHCVCM